MLLVARRRAKEGFGCSFTSFQMRYPLAKNEGKDLLLPEADLF